MTSARWLPVLAVAVAVSLAGCSAAAPAPQRGPVRVPNTSAPGAEAVVVLDGDVHRVREITGNGLEKSVGKMSVDVTWWGGPGVGARFERHTESGLDLLRADPFSGYDAGPAGTPVQSAVLLAVGADGATAAVSYVELATRRSSDGVSGPGGVLLSYQEDGRYLDRPRLIVVGDRTPDRAIRDVVELRIVRLDR
ncbi:hypothetical protein [Pseudonocardia sp. KRD291]|uniref:hypothetical protein n=1 Tax=Pseudonocardia sp. KRD291 TaxID=2792007 RepID=UPI001C4A4B16|nr:hypothetical protein [Pseudonocardia sp. KRD291]MBW0101721.1 hypothetical protein [Pseudonocardia sp. KRD291]